MRISELLNESIVTEISRPDIDQAQEILKQAGYEMIGSGFESLVFRRGTDPYVLKLIDADAKAYFEFIKLTKTANNVHFPVFKGNLIKVTDFYYAIRMEPLVELSANYKPVAKIVDRYTVAIQNADGNEVDFPEMDELEKSQPGIKEACHLIVTSLYNNPHYYNDLHIDNFMMRGSTLVITDPVIFDDTEYE